LLGLTRLTLTAQIGVAGCFGPLPCSRTGQTDIDDVTALSGAENVARSANFQIAHRYFKARS